MKIVHGVKCKGKEFRTVYMFDSLREAMDTVWAFGEKITDMSDVIYRIENLTINADIGFDVYELTDGESIVSFMYQQNGLNSNYATKKDGIKEGQVVSIIGLIGDIGDPLDWKVKGIKITEEPESVNE